MDTIKIPVKMVVDLAWMARRYADERSTHVTSLYNEIAAYLLCNGITLDTCDDIVWACDGMGRDYDHLTDKQAKSGTREALGLDLLDAFKSRATK